MPAKNVWIRLSVVIGLVAALALVGSASAQGGTVVRVDPAAATVAAGQTVTVSIRVESVTNLSGAEIHLAFNASLLEVVDADPAVAGVQIANGGMLSPDFVAQNAVDNAAGAIDFAVAQVGKPGVNGSGALATINFRAKSVAGASPLTFRPTPSVPNGVLLVDPASTPIAFSTQLGTVTVTGPTVTPGGPTFTPTPTTTPGTPTPTPTPGSGTPGKHTVRAGETLFCIGRAYAVSPWAIATANNIYAPYRLFIGRVLTIPNAPWSSVPPGPTCARQFGGTPPPITPGPTPTPQPGCRAMYTVVWGDTLSAIARRYNVNLYTLAARNNIYNLNLIFVGQVLCIP